MVGCPSDRTVHAQIWDQPVRLAHAKRQTRISLLLGFIDSAYSPSYPRSEPGISSWKVCVCVCMSPPRDRIVWGLHTKCGIPTAVSQELKNKILHLIRHTVGVFTKFGNRKEVRTMQYFVFHTWTQSPEVSGVAPKRQTSHIRKLKRWDRRIQTPFPGVSMNRPNQFTCLYNILACEADIQQFTSIMNNRLFCIELDFSYR